MNQIFRTGCLSLSLTALLLAGCGGDRQQGAQPEATPVSAYRVTTRDIPETILLPGRVIAGSEVAVSATVPGQLEAVSAKVGDRVQAGQLLATLNNPSASSSLQEAKRNLQTLEGQLDQLRHLGGQSPAGRVAELQEQIRRRIRDLTETAKTGKLPGQAELVASGQELVRLQTELARLQTESAVSESLNQLRAPLLQGLQMQVEQARQLVKAAEAQAAAARITAPIAGTVLAQNAAKGAPALPGTPLFSIGSVEQVEFEVLLDPNVVPRLQAGQAAAVQVGTQPAAQTKLASVSPAVQPQAKSFTARAALPNPNGWFKPGMIGQATITLAAHKGVLSVPKAAVLRDANGPFVMRIENDQARLVRIKPGYDNGTWVEVLSGLQQDERIVYGGVERMQPGMKVTVTETEPAS
ncbi:RND family efflux transporter MFP subunit [Tumebacillus sp. BK434]|uniref:efflux RND transporter periplasmic adaptor subunit n=1 Tax=Tumebacillus sp. BK434 TaxID=2512169 RepID=UPI0010E7DE60|nr:efflux RND transporter periplasmic adaptor subunit [Tumebacillus sp. BK434]TCP59436.1 RND family efflux transporter MFP subunit [Tumebacillus sp. BK434]